MPEEILVVDDDPQMLVALEESIRLLGYSVATASSGSEALCRIGERAFRLVITDLRMPGVTGIDLLRKVQSLAPQLRVILLTAHGTIENAVDAMRYGAFDYLLKPFSAEAVERVIRRAMATNADGRRESHHEIVTQDPVFMGVLKKGTHAAISTATILVEAESGTGKELLARMIHHKSERSGGPFVAVNCAALPENLLESELFGFEKGAFTGAVQSKPGKFERAHGGTLLLDEIGEMAPILQAKLLRVLQEGEVDRVGGRDPVRIDVRVIATTNRDLASLVRTGEFREDLYYRLNVIPLTIPPLRERPGDIPLLTDLFCKRYGKEFSKPDIRCSDRAQQKLAEQPWPGNVRELENTIQRAIALCDGSVIEASDLTLSGAAATASSRQAGRTVREMEKQLIIQTLNDTNGNRTRAAQILGISLRTLRNKLNEFGLQDKQAKVAYRGV